MWLDFRRGQYPKNCGRKNFRQKEKPTGCRRFDPLFGSSNNPLFGPLSITNIAQHSVLVEFNCMFASCLRSVRGARVETPQLEYSFVGTLAKTPCVPVRFLVDQAHFLAREVAWRGIYAFVYGLVLMLRRCCVYLCL